MISKLILGDKTVIRGVQDIQTTIMNLNGSIEHALCIVVGPYEDVRPTAEEIYEQLSRPGALTKIVAAKRDYIPGTIGPDGIQGESIYSDEYYVDFLMYNSIKAVYKSESNDVVTATLVTAPNDLSDSRYNELLTAYKDLSLAMSEILGL